jgi:hypothetical protein
MTALARVYDLYIDVDAPGGSDCLLDLSGSPRSAGNPVRWIFKDIFEIRLHYRRRAVTLDGVVEVVEQPASWAIVLAGKAAAVDATLLFAATDFVRVETTDDVYYSAMLTLDTTELATVMDAVAVGSALSVLVDVENQDAGNTARLTFQFSVHIKQQVYDNESDPTPAAPAYPAPGAILVKIGGSEALTAEQDYVEVGGLGCATVPQVIIATVRKPAGGANLFATIVHSSITVDGFRADLSGSPPDAGYYLDFFIML